MFDIDDFTADDYRLGRLRHWLIGGMEVEGDIVTFPGHDTLSLQRDPHPETTPGTPLSGQITWFDYVGKHATRNDLEGTLRQPRFIARVRPDRSPKESQFVYFEHNAQAHPTRQIETWTLPNGTAGTRTNRFVYAADGIDLLKITNAAGVLVMSNLYVYGGTHLVATNYNALAEMTRFTYNAQQQLTSIRRPSGLITTNLYDANGWLTTVIDYEHPDGGSATYYRTNGYTWDKGLVKTHTDPRNLLTTNFWDGLGRLLGVGFPDGSTISNLYYKLDNTGYSGGTGSTNLLDRTATKDRTGAWAYFVYNRLRQLTDLTNALGRVTHYEYCDCGSIEQITDGLGQNTYFYHDLLGRLTNALYHGGAYSLTNRFNLVGELTVVSDSLGSVTNWFGNQGVHVGSSNIFGRVFLTTLDVLDRPTNRVDAAGVTVTNSFDAFDRLLTRTMVGAGTDSFGYSPRGLTNAVNPLGTNTWYAYDALGRLTNEVHPGLMTNRFTYNAAGDVLTLADGKSQTTKWDYDGEGQALRKYYADDLANPKLIYTYAPGGRLTNRWSKAKLDTRYQYDAVGNLTSLVYTNGVTIGFAYDALNRLTNLVDAVGTTRYSYAYHALASEDGPWVEDTVNYTYQNGQRRSGLTLLAPNGSPWTQAYAYDAAERLTNLTSAAGVFSYLYAGGRGFPPAAVLLPNGSQLTNWVDTAGRLYRTELRNSAAAVLNAHGYGYNVASQRISATNWAANTWSYGYDGAGQLVVAQGKESGGTSRAQEQFGYKYDAAGNLNARTNNALVQTFNVNSVNQLTTLTRSGTLTVAGMTTPAATGVTVKDNSNQPQSATLYADKTFARSGITLLDGNNTFTAVAQDSLGRLDTNTVVAYLPDTVTCQYDDNGNLVSDGRRGFAYDAENQLTTVTVTNVWHSRFVYDGLGRRRLRMEAVWVNGAWATNQVVRYVYDGMCVLQERDGNNVPQVTYTRGLDLSGTLEGAGGIGGLLALTRHASPLTDHFFYHADGNGNVTSLTDGKQQIAARYVYDPYGNLLGLHGRMAEVNLYRFSSKEFHASSALYYYGFRFYEPSLQRWHTRDPIGHRGGGNLHRFVGCDPVNRRDALGLWSPEAHDEIFNRCFGNGLAPELLEELKQSSRSFDERTMSDPNKHALCGKDQTPQEARAKLDEFIKDRIRCAQREYYYSGDISIAMHTLAEAMHAASDSTSPAHIDRRGNPRRWTRLLSPNALGHSPNESIGSERVKHLTPEILRQNSALLQQILIDFWGYE